MRVDFSDGSFMLSWDTARAWYTADGEMKDCEKKFKYKNRLAARAIPKSHKKVREWLAQQGKTEARLLQEGRLKRRAA